MDGILAVRVVAWVIVVASLFALAVGGIFIYLVRRK